MLQEVNRRAKIFVCVELVGTKGFCTWEDLRKIGEYHHIENHSYCHVNHIGLDYTEQKLHISMAQEVISDKIGFAPQNFVAPYNKYDLTTDKVVKELGLISIKNRINILNISK